VLQGWYVSIFSISDIAIQNKSREGKITQKRNRVVVFSPTFHSLSRAKILNNSKKNQDMLSLYIENMLYRLQQLITQVQHYTLIRYNFSAMHHQADTERSKRRLKHLTRFARMACTGMISPTKANDLPMKRCLTRSS
jgi:hypothetical protein